MAQVTLKLRGVTLAHLVASSLSAYPLAYIAYFAVTRGFGSLGPSASVLLIAAFGVALLPWMSRAVARRLHRATCDDIAIHVRGEALPYRTITKVTVEKSPRRHLLVLTRGETTTFRLVLWDAFAGRLTPLKELTRHLAEHGHNLALFNATARAAPRARFSVVGAC